MNAEKNELRLHVDFLKDRKIYLVSASYLRQDGRREILFYGSFTSLDRFKAFSQGVIDQWPSNPEDQIGQTS